MTEVVRVGDTVRRRPAPPFVHRLLDHLADWPGAPRFLGIDERGREILTFVDGVVPWQSPLRSPESLTGVARLMREFHDRTAGSALAGAEEVVCHNDLSPKNTVYHGERPIAFVDWDIAAPGARDRPRAAGRHDPVVAGPLLARHRISGRRRSPGHDPPT